MEKSQGSNCKCCSNFLIILLAYIADPGISENTFKRWSFLLLQLEKKTLTQILNDERKSFIVLKDESNTIRFSLSASSRRKPNYAELIKSNDSKFHLVSTLNGGIYEFNIPPQSEISPLSLIVGDYQKEFSVNLLLVQDWKFSHP